MIEALSLIAIVLLLAAIGLIVLLLRRPEADLGPLQNRLDMVAQGQDRAERATKEELARNREEASAQARDLRQEVGAGLRGLNDSVLAQMTGIAGLQKNQL